MTPPFKWPGGKRRLVQHIHAAFGGGRCDGVYHEPYLGGGAVLLHLLDVKAIDYACANDIDDDLLRLWRDIRDDQNYLCEALGWLPKGVPTREVYETVRADFNEYGGSARMLWLLATCFNGAWRRNRAGKMNQCKGTHGPAYERDHIRCVSGLLRTVGFGPAAYVDARDWVYLDPPYPGTKGTYGHAYDPAFRAQAQAYADAGARVVVSLPPGPEADSFVGWHRTEVAHRYKVSRSPIRPPVVEVLLSSVDPLSS